MHTNETFDIAAAERAAQNDPSSFQAQEDLGWAYFFADRFEQALAAFHRAVALNPNAARSYNGIGRCCYNSGAYQTAIDAYERAITADPHFVDSYFGIAIVCSTKLGDLECAFEALRRGLAANPGDPLLTAEIGITYAHTGDFTGGIRALEQAAELGAESGFAYGWLAMLYLRTKQFDKAAAACHHEIAVQDVHSPHRMLGFIHELQGRLNEAIAELERSIALKPQDYEARAALAKLYQRNGRPTEAYEHLTLAREHAMQDEEYGLACVYAVIEEPDKAFPLLEKSLAKGIVRQGWLRIDPELIYLQDDPRFHALLVAV